MRLGPRSHDGWLARLLFTIASLAAAGCVGDFGVGGGEHEVGGGGAPGGSTSSSTGGDVGEAAVSGSGGGEEATSIWAGPLTAKGPCPRDMAVVEGFCVDRFEAPNVAGALPLVMQSAVSAEAWCAERGKRLCTEDEWVTACKGAEKTTYPYGDSWESGRCNDEKMWLAPDEATLNTWPSDAAKAEVDALYQAEPSGSLPGCASSYGVFDLTGNVEEWVVRTQYHVNEYPHVLKGCYWSGCYGGSKPRCESTNPAHADGFMFYETSFRCCRDADAAP